MILFSNIEWLPLCAQSLAANYYKFLRMNYFYDNLRYMLTNFISQLRLITDFSGFSLAADKLFDEQGNKKFCLGKINVP